MKPFIILLFPLCLKAQAVVTSFPSLSIPASSRGLGMGNTGIASATENQQFSCNVAKSAFIQNFHQVSLHYTPWLRAISEDTRFIAANYLGNVFNTSAIGIGLNYLDLGSVTTRDNNGAAIAAYHAKEFNLGASYALQLSAKSSLGIGLKFLEQNNFSVFPENRYSVGGDISYYQFWNIQGDANKKLEWGAVLSNLGPGKSNLPANFGIGLGYSATDPEDGTQFGITADMNKSIVPFFNTDMRELRVSTGMELGFLNQFFLRGGLSIENPYRGNRRFVSFGVGYQGFIYDQSWGIDFHYLVPFGTIAAVSPFQNALGFSLKINMGNFQ